MQISIEMELILVKKSGGFKRDYNSKKCWIELNSNKQFKQI